MATSSTRIPGLFQHLEASSLYRTIFERAHDGIAIIAPDGRYLEQNDAHERLLGWSIEELRSVTPAIHLGEEAFARVNRVLVETGWFRGELESRGRDGRIRMVELSAFPVRNDDGEIIAYVGAKRDVTHRHAVEQEQRRAHDALYRSKREFEALAEHSPDVIVRFDRDYRQLYVNPAIEQATGRPVSDFIGRTKRESHDDAVTDIWENAIDRVLDIGDAVDFEFMYDTPRGPRYFVTRLRPEIVEDGIVQTVIGTTRDVTDLKVAELRQRLLAEVGAALVTNLGYRDALAEVVRLVTGTFFDACAIDVAAEDGALERVAARSRTADDVDRLALNRQPGVVRRVPLAARGRTVGLITFVAAGGRTFSDEERDFSQELAGRVALAIDNLLLYQQAADANRTKSNFMATMSHELRTPLNAIIGYADLMDMNIGGPLTELHNRHLYRIRYSANHLLKVIEEILTFSRAEAGREEVRLGVADVVEIVRDAASLVEAAATAKSLQLLADLPLQPICVYTDAVKLRQVILNLLSNAVKFTDTGDVTITVAREGSDVRIAVVDTGIGIDAADLECVFDPFWQARSGATRTTGGTGLGLTVSRQLITLLGGQITASSRPGVGSRFEIRVPLTGVQQRASSLQL